MYSAYCIVQTTELYITLYSTAHCSMLIIVHCTGQYTYNVLFSTIHCTVSIHHLTVLVQYVTLCNILLCAVQYTVQYSTLYSAVHSNVKYNYSTVSAL